MLLQDAVLLHAILQGVIPHNPPGHPLLGGLWAIWCPVAAWWWQAGVRPETYRPHPLLRALDDYAEGGTLREHLEERYGLAKLLDDVRTYIQEVRLARQRLPHIPAPETLPTFPGGKIPLERRFGIQRELMAMSGEDGLLTYVRTWAFLVPDWKTALPYPDLELMHVQGALVLPGGVILRVRVWGWAPRGRPHAPYVLFSPPGPAVWQAVLWHLQSADRTPWPHAPQVWEGDAEGRSRPAVPPVDGSALLAWLRRAGTEVAQWSTPPLPTGALDGRRCTHCPFRETCFAERDQRLYPVPQIAAGVGGR